MALPPMAAQRQALITVHGIADRWSKISAISKKADGTKVFDGGSLTPEVLTAPALVDDVTVSRPFRPNRDAALLASLFKQVGRLYTSVTVSWTDANLVPVGHPTTVSGWLTGVDTPEADAGSGEAMMMQLTFTIDNAA